MGLRRRRASDCMVPVPTTMAACVTGVTNDWPTPLGEGRKGGRRGAGKKSGPARSGIQPAPVHNHAIERESTPPPLPPPSISRAPQEDGQEPHFHLDKVMGT